jgi:hypothetical protein
LQGAAFLLRPKIEAHFHPIRGKRPHRLGAIARYHGNSCMITRPRSLDGFDAFVNPRPLSRLMNLFGPICDARSSWRYLVSSTTNVQGRDVMT